MSGEIVVSVVKCYSSNKYQLAVSIPAEIRHRLGLMSGMKFIVKLDDKSRIIFEPTEMSSSKNEQSNQEVSDK